MTRKWKIINSLIAWLIFFSLVQPAYGAWDTLTAEVTFTAQTGVWTTDPAPTPAAEPAAASATPPGRECPGSARPRRHSRTCRYPRTRGNHRHPSSGACPGNARRPHSRIPGNTNPAGKFRGRVKKDFTNRWEFVIIDKHSKSDPVAQLEERYLDMVEVVGSSPIGITIN